MNGYSYFLGALYHNRGAFSLLPDFTKHFYDDLVKIEFDRKKVLDYVLETSAKFRKNTDKPIDRNGCLRLVLADELDNISRKLSEEKFDLTKEVDYEKSLVECRDQGIKFLKKIGVQVPEVFPVRIWDELPPPFLGKPITAMVSDSFDHKHYGTPVGIHFLKGALRPFYSRFLLLHELIHTITGSISPELFARGLEEGFCELLGALYLSQKILGTELTINLFVYNRLSAKVFPVWELYLEYTRQSALLYRRFGFKGISEVLRHGRVQIKQLEEYLLSNQIDAIKLPSGNWNNEFSDLVDFITSGFVRNIVVEPEAFYILPYIRPGTTINEVVDNCNMRKETVENAFDQLQEANVVLVHNGRIDISDLDMLLKARAIRYNANHNANGSHST